MQNLKYILKIPIGMEFIKFKVFQTIFEAGNTLAEIDFLLGSIYLRFYGYSEHIWVYICIFLGRNSCSREILGKLDTLGPAI